MESKEIDGVELRKVPEKDEKIGPKSTRESPPYNRLSIDRKFFFFSNDICNSMNVKKGSQLKSYYMDH